MKLEISNLNVSFKTRNGPKHVVHNFNLNIGSGEIVGVVGESGSGKSVTARTILGLINRSKMEVSGEIILNGELCAVIAAGKIFCDGDTENGVSTIKGAFPILHVGTGGL